MTVTDELLANARRYAETFDKGELPLPPAKHVAVVDPGIKPSWAAEAFDDLDASIRQNIARIRAEPSIPVKDSIRGFVHDVHTGALREVTA